MSPSLESKLPQVGTTIFTVMSVLAAELGAVNLGQGYPDFPMSEELVSLVAQAMREVIHEKLRRTGGEGGAIGVDPAGNVAMDFNSAGMFRGVRDSRGRREIAMYDDAHY